MLLKNTILLILLGAFISVGFAQSVTFHLKRYTVCNPEGKIDSTFLYIKDTSGRVYECWWGTTILPGPGHYKLFTASDFPLEGLPEIDIPDQSSYTYHYYEKKIEKLSAIGLHGVDTYYTCSKPINGYMEDLYPNGKMRIRGNFIEGRPKDSLVNFYPNGNVSSRKRYFRKGIYYSEYDSLGNLSLNKFTAFQPGYPKNGYEIRYFSNGKIFRKEIIKKNKTFIKEYFPDGKLKFERKN